MTTFEKLREIISENAVIEPGDITLESTAQSLILDSLDCVELSIAVEDEFEIAVNDDEMDKVHSLTTVEEMVKMIDLKLSNAK